MHDAIVIRSSPLSNILTVFTILIVSNIIKEKFNIHLIIPATLFVFFYFIIIKEIKLFIFAYLIPCMIILASTSFYAKGYFFESLKNIFLYNNIATATSTTHILFVYLFVPSLMLLSVFSSNFLFDDLQRYRLLNYKYVRQVVIFLRLLLKLQAIFRDTYEKSREGLIARYLLTQNSPHIKCIYHAGPKFISTGIATSLQLNAYLKTTKIDIMNYVQNDSFFITKTEWISILILILSVTTSIYYFMV